MPSRRTVTGFVFTALVLFAIAAVPARADKCTGAKLKAVGKKEAGLLKCQAKVAATNDPSGLVACESKVMGKFAAAFAKAGVCAGDQTRCEDIADGCDSAMGAFLTDTFPSKCESSKRKAAGKLAGRELGCYSKAAAKGLALDTTCITKAQGKFGAAMTKAGGCPDGGSPQNEVENNCVQRGVTTNGGGMVTDVCPACGTFVTKWGSFGSGDGQFNQPRGVAVDGSGNVFVDDTGNNRIQKFTNTGTFLLSFGWGVADGMAAFETCTTGCQAGIFGSGDGQFNFPNGLAVDGSGNVFVADTNNDRIQKFTNTGTFLTKWGSTGSGDGQFAAPRGVAVDGSGNVFVAEQNNDRVQKFDGNGMFLTKWGSLGSGDGQFTDPRSVAVDASGNVFVAEFSGNRVQKFTNTGTFLLSFGWGVADGMAAFETCTTGCQAGISGSGDGQFNLPFGIAVDGSRSVFVDDFGNDRIQKFTNTGTFVTKWGSFGGGNGQFAGSIGVAVDGSGHVFVVERDNERIQKFACP